MIDSDAIQTLPSTQNVLRQINEHRTHKQQELQTRIQTQLLQAQAQVYLRQKQEEFDRKRTINEKHEKKKHSLYDIESITNYDNNNNTANSSENNSSFDNSTESRVLLCLDRFGNLEFSAQFLSRFHWISQVILEILTI